MKVLIFFIRIWGKFLSPLFGCNCRYFPNCSLYMEQSLIEYGILRGIYLGFLRICRCNSLFEGGYDPVCPSHLQRINTKYGRAKRSRGKKERYDRG